MYVGLLRARPKRDISGFLPIDYNMSMTCQANIHILPWTLVIVMKGTHKVMMTAIVLALLSSNAISVFQTEPCPCEYYPSDQTVTGEPGLLTGGPSDPEEPGQKASYAYTRESMSRLSEEEYIEKWYGDELDFNMSLISSVKRLTFDGVSGSASFSPDGKKLIFQRDGDGLYEQDIWMMDTDGTNLTQLTWGNPSDCQPSFLSDGIHFMYIKGGYRWMTICVQNLQDNTSKQITKYGMHPKAVANNMIMYISNETTILVDSELENFIYLPDGMNGHWPDMNADGTRVVFEAYHVQQYNHLLLADLPNGTIRQLTFEKINHNNPAISPDGQKIVYNTHWSPPARNYSNLWLYDVTSGSHHQLTFGKTSDWASDFSPDGRQIAFTSRRGNEGWNFDIWILTLKPSY